jgi:hypothetical protein
VDGKRHQISAGAVPCYQQPRPYRDLALLNDVKEVAQRTFGAVRAVLVASGELGFL